MLRVKDLFPEITDMTQWESELQRFDPDTALAVEQRCPTCAVLNRLHEVMKRYQALEVPDRCPVCGHEMELDSPFSGITTWEQSPEDPVIFSAVFRCDNCIDPETGHGMKFAFVPIRVVLEGNHYRYMHTTTADTLEALLKK
jgi:hypothetical protein